MMYVAINRKNGNEDELYTMSMGEYIALLRSMKTLRRIGWYIVVDYQRENGYKKAYSYMPIIADYGMPSECLISASIDDQMFGVPKAITAQSLAEAISGNPVIVDDGRYVGTDSFGEAYEYHITREGDMIKAVARVTSANYSMAYTGGTGDGKVIRFPITRAREIIHAAADIAELPIVLEAIMPGYYEVPYNEMGDIITIA